MAVRLHIGTSGWSYKHWHGLFYPEDLKPAKFLEYYFTKFDCVELNSSFYHLPLKTTVEGWLKRTPDQFIFCPKLSRYITHQLRLLNTREALFRYFDIFDALKKKIGPVLIQLPPGLPFDKSRTEAFFGILTDKFHGYRFAVEIRHKSWINEEFFEMLEKSGLAFVIADSGNRYPYFEKITTDFVYLRFHGNGQLYASDYSNAELDFYSGKINSWLAENKEVWVFFNNDVHGYALNNAIKLKEFTVLKMEGQFLI
ncbi:MAG TPA: DUF72 domain-containing protein [Bacteroidales bacterium]|jgi:uncharacterized protein YecE (DUF72 family)|nr:DUF72 domain-containing protein [Bacteroidales bacterium]